MRDQNSASAPNFKINWPDITFGPINLHNMQQLLPLEDRNPIKEHVWLDDGVDIHKGEYCYKCADCGMSDWIAAYGKLSDLGGNTKCKPGWKNV